MTKNNITNREDGNGKQHVTHPSQSKGSGIVRLALLGVMMIFALGISRCPPDRAPSLGCSDVPMVIEPGTCVEFTNPCDNHQWSRPPAIDFFELDLSDRPNEEQVNVKTTRLGDDTTRSICVGADSPAHVAFPMGFTYGREVDYGRASIILTVAHPLAVSVTAAPSTINVGESSQLVANASGGIPPYFYSWAPESNLDRHNVAAPIATPPATTTYTVTITDSANLHAQGSVTVFVGLHLTVTANPEVIIAGESAQLAAILSGGYPPYSVAWTPEASLNDPSRIDPIATPTTTTTYNVVAFDSAGASRQGSVTVIVDPPLMAHAEANPATINLGQTSQLHVSVTGGRAPYSYIWGGSSASSLSDPFIQNPIASPTATTTYEVSVRDSQGHVTLASVKVTVITSPPPTASFVFNVICCPTLNLDASASTGNIVSYTWDLSWTPVNPDRVTSSPTTTFPIREFDRGTITLTVTDAAGNTATTTRNF